MADGVPICRNCHEGGGDLIAPCSCSGSIKWVHRKCLDTWRAVSPNPASFTTCDICKAKYRLRHKSVGACAYFSLVLKCLRDLLAINLVIWSMVFICGLFAWGLDLGTQWTGIAFPASWLPTMQHPAFEILCFGSLALCFFIGIFSIFAGIASCLCPGACCGGREETHVITYDTYGYNSWMPPYWWWFLYWNPPYYSYHTYYTPCYCGNCGGGGAGDCSCHGSDCNCSGGGGGKDAGTAIVIAILVVVVIIALIGFFVGVAFLIYLMGRMMGHHMKVLHSQMLAQGLEVIDLAKDPNAQSEPGIESEIIPPPTSPLLASPPAYVAGYGPECCKKV